jgi:myo-inositol 2-dehydrogenase/D-chiro-inositol 1-dehydrogenase
MVCGPGRFVVEGNDVDAGKKLNVGVLGLGRMGTVHAAGLARHVPRARLLALADADLSAALRVAAELGLDVACCSTDEALSRDDIEAVVIATPTGTHGGLIERASAAGKHIFCEKPIALELEVIDQSLDVVASTGVLLQVGFNRRFDANFQRMRSGIAAGEIGAVHLFHIMSRDPCLPPLEYLRTSGGMFLDMMIHDFDMARFLIGEEIEEVFAMGAARIDPRVASEAQDVDTAMVAVRMSGGTLGAIDNSRRAVYGYDQRVEVFGADGLLRAENGAPDQVERIDATGRHGPRPFLFFSDRYPQTYITEMRGFVDAVLDGGTPPVVGADGRAAHVAALAARKSFELGRPVRTDEVNASRSTEESHRASDQPW